MIPSAEVTLDRLVRLLDDAVIDHEKKDEDSVYVTGLAFNLWIRLDSESQFVSFSSYWEFGEEVNEAEKLRFINGLNIDLMMLQFYVGNPENRLCGHYSLPVQDGLDERQFLRAARLFGDIFRSAITFGGHRDLLEPWPLNSDDLLLNPSQNRVLN